MIDLMPSASLLRIIVSTEDLERACALYRDLLGLEVRQRQEEFVRLGLPGGQELLLHHRSVERGDSAVAAGFNVTDVRALVNRWRDAGGEVLDKPVAQPWGEIMAVVRDPDGPIVCLSEIAKTLGGA